MKLRPLILLFLTGFLINIHGTNLYSAGDRKLETEHFVIIHGSLNIPSAVETANRLELFYEEISSFLEYDYPYKTVIKLVENRNSIEIDGETFLLSDIFSDKVEYVNVFRRNFFMNYLKKLYGWNSIQYDEVFAEAVAVYTINRDKQLSRIIDDLVNNDKIFSVDPENIKLYSKNKQIFIQVAFIDFIISEYSNRLFIRSLKDSGYFHGFYNAVSAISGDSKNTIIEKFKLKLRSYTKGNNKPEKLIELLPDHTDTSCISFSITGENSFAALLAGDNKNFLVRKNNSETEVTELPRSDNNSRYTSLSDNNEKVILSETVPRGTIIHVFKKADKTPSQNFNLPLLYVTDIFLYKDSNIVFSANYGTKNDIFLFNPVNGKIKNLTFTGDNFSPVEYNNYIFYLSVKNTATIKRLDINTGETSEIFYTEGKINNLQIDKNGAINFTISAGNDTIIASIDNSGKNYSIIDRTDRNISKMEIHAKKIYFISLFKSLPRLIFYNY